MESGTFKRTLVTSALPYANGYVHLGHLAGAYLPADIYTRYLRSSGQDVLHVSGSDEYGVAITIAAEKEGVQPKDIIDKYHFANRGAFEGIGIAFDYYGRTSSEIHVRTTQSFFTDLHRLELLIEREQEQFFDSEAGMFLPDRYVEGTCPNCGFEGARGDQCDNCSATYDQTQLENPISKISGKPPVLRTTRHLFFQLGKLQEVLERYVESHAGDWKENVLQQARSWLKQGLGDRSITRDLTWGIDVPIPGYEGKKIYVWFDAPIGYISITQEFYASSADENGWKRWWCDPDTRYLAFIGKDNIVFHTLIFPATLVGHNKLTEPESGASGEGRPDIFILPDNVPANEFLNLEGRKFSKSQNWGIDLRDYLAEYPPDPLRYTLAANMPENKDADFTWREYQARTNNELADILGNFVNRTMQFAGRYFDGVVPPLVHLEEKGEEVKALLAEDLRRAVASAKADEAVLDELEPKYLKYFTRTDLTMLLAIARAPERIGALYGDFRFREAALETMNVARAANKYFNDSEPWKTRKESPERCATAIAICLQVVRSLAILFEPIIPFTVEKIWAQLGVGRTSEDTWGSAAALRLPGGHRLGEPNILVQKVEDEVVEREIAKLGASADGAAEAAPIEVELKPEVTIEDVMKLDLRMATILAAERVKKSDKLLKLQIRIGNLQRQIVAGIGKQYEPESLVGRKIVVVANLKPAKLMGQDSQGMLLAANPPESAPILVTVLDEGDVRDGVIVR